MADLPREPAREPIVPFPAAGLDGFLSHFVIAIEFHEGQDELPVPPGLAHITLPSALQTVARSSPFRYEPRGPDHVVDLAVPPETELRARIRRSDFLVSPPGFFEGGRETIWLQIVNLDARGDTPIGPVRIILGETFKREYPDVFEPSYGAIESIPGRGFPARLFFSPNAVLETPIGPLKTRPKALVGARVTELPPIGSYPALLQPVPLDRVEALRDAAVADRPLEEVQPAATLRALAHPIDANLLTEDPYKVVASAIAR